MAVTNPIFLYPVRFDATSYTVRVEHGTTPVVEDLPFPVLGASLEIGRDYWLSGDGEVDDATGNGDLIAILEAALNANIAGVTYAVTHTAENRLVISADQPFIVRWSYASSTLDETVFGGVEDDPDPAATSTTLARSTRGAWSPGFPSWDDTRDQQPISGGFARSVSGLMRSSFFGYLNKERDLSWDLLPKARTLQEYRNAAVDTEGTLEDLWLLAGVLGRRVRYYADESIRSAFTVYRFRDANHPIERSGVERLRWRAQLRLVNDTAGTFTSGGGSGGSSTSSGVQPARLISTGDGLTGGGDLSIDRTHSLDFAGLTPSTSPVTSADYLAVYVAGSAAHKKVLIDDLGVSGGAPTSRLISTGDGLTGGGDLTADRTHSLDVSSLAAETTPTTSTDYLIIYSATSAAHKKVLIDDLGVSGGGSASKNIIPSVQTVAGTTEVLVGSVYLEAQTIATLRAYLGEQTASATAYLKLKKNSDGSTLSGLSSAAQPADVSATSITVTVADWYDFYLYASAAAGVAVCTGIKIEA